MKYLIPTYLFCFLGVIALAQASQEKKIIDRARATLGSETALDGLITLQIEADLRPADSTLPSASLLIIARKPSSQRLEIRIDDMVETTILSDRRACILRSNLIAGATQMRDLEGPELERVIYSTRQFFNFFRPCRKGGEKVRLEGIEDFKEVRSYKLNYEYPSGLSTKRYFSIEDGTLLATVVENGVVSVGKGEQIVGGIKFPESIDYFLDEYKLHTIVLKKIKVNKPLTAGIFDIPEGGVE